MNKPQRRRVAKRQAERKQEQNRSIQLEQRTELFHGPVPSPAALREYEEIQPGFAQRLIALGEREAAHRHSVTLKAQAQDALETTLGQVFALGIALASFICTAWLGYLGLEAAASIVGGTTVVGLVSAFIAGRTLR